MTRAALRAARARAVGGRPRDWRAPRLPLLAILCLLAFLCACTGAQAKIYFRAASSATTASGSSVTVNAPANTTVGDLLIIDIDTNGGSTSFAVPSGWTSVYAGTNYSGGTLGGGYTVVAYKVAALADVGASYVISLGATRAAVARIVDYVGVETSNPVENTFPLGTNPAGGASATSFSYPSVTTTASNSMVVFAAVAFHSGSATTITPPSGSTDRAKASVTGTSPDITVDNADLVQASAGAVSKTGTIAASSPWGAVTFALKPGAGALGFDVTPSTPTLPAITLNGQAQTTNATMNNFAVDDTSSETGWNVTVLGNTSAGKSPVFKQYCENGSGACGSTPANSYVSGGRELPAGSLRLSTSGASWTTTGGSGTAPAFQCSSSACSVDAASQTKIVSTAIGGGLGPWSTSGFSATSLALLTPTTIRVLPEHEIYRVDLLWTLASGP